jgi:hypothetical protein
MSSSDSESDPKGFRSNDVVRSIEARHVKMKEALDPVETYLLKKLASTIRRAKKSKSVGFGFPNTISEIHDILENLQLMRRIY